MKRYIQSLMIAVMTLFVAAGCSPDDYSLGSSDITSDDLVEGIAYTITHDTENPNIVYLTSLMGSSYTALWEHPQGRDQGELITLKMPFAGTYDVVFGVETRAGVVYGDTTTFTIDDFCAEFVEDDLWTYISGGVGNSKRWYIDLDQYGASKYFYGPVYFYGTDDSWATVTDGETLDTDVYDSWYWQADWSSVAGWQWASYAMDFGYMEFDLIDGSNVTVVCNDLGTTNTGKYMLDTDNHTITFTDAPLLHDSMNDDQVASWTGQMKLMSLTEDYMQIAVLRTADPCLLVFNFISQDYYDNYVEETNSDVTPELDDDWRDYVEPKTNKVITYKLSDDTPFDWCNLNGSQKGISTSTAADGIEDITLVLNSGTSEWTLTDADGDETSGTYSLSDDGIYTFSSAWPEITLSTDGAAVLKTNSDNTLRILAYEVDDYSGALSDLWIGSQEIDDQGNLYQYLGYHFCPQTSGTTTKYTTTLNFFDTSWNFITSDKLYIEGSGTYTISVVADGVADGTSPYGVYLDIEKILKTYPNLDIVINDIKVDGSSISFDDTLIDRGVGDAETTARRYVLNPWSGSITDLDAYTAEFKFTSSIAVTFTLTTDTGSPFITSE